MDLESTTEYDDEDEFNESTLFNESAEFRGDVDSSFGSDLHSASFQEISTALRIKPDINIFYRTPCSGSNRFSRRSINIRTPIDHINKLPENLLLRIFAQLNKIDLVHVITTCNRFNLIGKDHSLWEFMNMGKRVIDETSLHSLLDRRIQVLRMAESQIQSAPPILSGYDFSNLQICRLTHLDLSQATFPDRQTLSRLLSRCKSLIAFSLERCELVDDEICREISKNQNLRFLDLVYVRTLSKFGLGGILCNCRRLTEVNLAWATLGRDAISIVCQFLPPTLRRLNFSGFREHPQMTDENVTILCKTCPYLEELDLADNTLITEKCLPNIAKLKYLSKLDLSRCYGIEPVSFISLSFLQSLNIFGCITSEGVKLLRNRLSPTAINESYLCAIAKPTVGDSLTSIWGRRTRDLY